MKKIYFTLDIFSDNINTVLIIFINLHNMNAISHLKGREIRLKGGKHVSPPTDTDSRFRTFKISDNFVHQMEKRRNKNVFKNRNR